MGLVYDPNEMKQLSNHIKENINNGKVVLNHLVSATNKLVNGTGSGTNLDSHSIIAWRAKVSEKLVELQKFREDLTNTEKSLQKFDNVIEYAGSEHLDEDNLNKQINSNQHLIEITQNQINIMVNNNSNHMKTNKITEAYSNSLASHRDTIINYQNRIEELNKKLEKLHKVNSEIGVIFNSSIKSFKNEHSIIDEISDMANQVGMTYDQFKDVYSTITKKFKNGFGVTNFINLLIFMKKGNLTKADFIKYGAHGEKTLNYLMQDWRVIKKELGKMNNPAAQKMLKLMKGSFNQFLKNLDKWKDYKGMSKYVKPLNNFLSWGLDAFNTSKSKATNYIVSKLGDVTSKLSWLKSIGKVAGVAGWGVMAYGFLNDAKSDFKNEKGDVFQKLGKSAIHAGISQLKKAGPVEYALIGAKFGPVGAGVGFAIGGINAIAGVVSPKWKEAFYNGIENTAKGAVDLVDNTARNVGNAVHNAWNGLASWFGGGNHTYGH